MTAPVPHNSIDRKEKAADAPPPAASPDPLVELLPAHPKALVRQVGTITALLLFAGVANIFGAPQFVGLGLLAASLVGILMLWRGIHLTRRQASAEAEAPAARAEAIADRMWELHESEEHFLGLIDALGDLVIHRDRDGRIVYANKVFANLVGRPQEELAGLRLADLGIEVGVVPDAAFADGECLSSTDVPIHTAAGTRWFSWIELSMRHLASKSVSHRAIARDITARKRAETALIGARERAEYASVAKSRFLATVSHEIRTPMNGIMGMAKLLADTSLSAEQKTYVSAVSTSASALLALIEDLLDFSKIEAGRFVPEPQPVSPREMVESVVELLASRAYGKDIGLASFVAPNVPHTITADPGRVRQVLLNLIGNAIKFTDAGGVLVSVALKPGDVDFVRFAVADTGPGLRKEDMERIFEEFEQADGGPTRTHGGAGLGLAISRRIVEALGGSIAATSDYGLGSEFAFEIPATEASGSNLTRGAVLEGHRSIIVSHNEVECDAIARTIRAHGGTVDVAYSADQAAELTGPCHALLIDAALESPDGKVLKRLKQSGFSGSQAITLIAPTDRGALGDFRASGYVTFLARPVRGETLLRVLLSGAASAAITAAPAPRASSRGRSARVAGLSVLLAEDNEINALLARTTLQKAGHRVEVVSNGRAAVEAVVGPRKERHDVVLMDLHMPMMDGLEAIALIRRHEEENNLPPVPIMVLSADSQEKTRHEVLAHGASGFVTKPLDPDALVHAVEERGA
ncbi:response regulator [Mesorhizobium sp. LHD-90]|uniref:response regulator n=1 Tax=Mesorhizobium sp. LHD-90 TaxID=3071414 RepID=UPI0027DFB8BA|nr:response regulator [Mesorhizobium sp. LHD-90]MDQ6434649.1 response regulator [Mesorhizobium sp. LHD-90]